MRSKIEEHAGIQIPIYYYEDNGGNKVYDYESMAEEFENELILAAGAAAAKRLNFKLIESSLNVRAICTDCQT